MARIDDRYLDLMYRKRFIINEQTKQLLDNSQFHHIACCIKNENVLSYGQNHYPVKTNHFKNYRCCSIHAEHDAIRKLPFSRKPVKIDLIVLRLTITKKVCMSKPCNKCVKYMLNDSLKHGYIIKDIWYSNDNGDIVKTNLSKLVNES
jgi:deoxycytidylate deaminase